MPSAPQRRSKLEKPDAPSTTGRASKTDATAARKSAKAVDPLPLPQAPKVGSRRPSKTGEEDKSTRKSTIIQDRVKHEADLCKKMKIAKVEGVGVIDTNVAGKKGNGSLLAKYEEGDLECQLIERVEAGDIEWVTDILAKGGRELLFSPYGGGIAKTSILYAAKHGSLDMVRLLVRYGGKELLQVKDLKQRDAKHYAEKHGMAIDKVTADATVDCWNQRYGQGRESVPGRESVQGKESSAARRSTVKKVDEGDAADKAGAKGGN